MSLNYLMTDGQANSGSCVSASAVQSLKGFKNALEIFFVNSYPVIRDFNIPGFLPLVIRAGQVDNRGYIRTMIFNGVGNQVLKNF